MICLYCDLQIGQHYSLADLSFFIATAATLYFLPCVHSILMLPWEAPARMPDVESHGCNGNRDAVETDEKALRAQNRVVDPT